MMKDTDAPIKKRRKAVAQQEDSPRLNSVPAKMEQIDIYQSVINYEEAEALSRDAETDQALFNEHCNKLRQIMNDIAVLKTQKTEKSKSEIAELRIQGALLFVPLKKLNRLEKFRTKHTRDTLNRVKQQVDSSHLQLQNLLYEILHLKKEVDKCLQFKSKDEEIDLVPEEEFFKEAPPNIARSSLTKKDQHQLRLARLEWELQQRKDLLAQCHKKEELKAESEKKIAAQRARLDSLGPLLRNVLDATKPLQECLGNPLDKNRKLHRLSRYLPKPLYVLYVQAEAYRQAYDPLVSVMVHGDEDAASLVTAESEPTADEESEEEEDNSHFQESTSGRHRKSTSRGDRQAERRKRLLAAHPLSVEVMVRLADGSAIVLTFSHLSSLGIVTVAPRVEPARPVSGIAASELILPHRILSALVPRDTGRASPCAANAYQLRRAGLDGLPADLGVPYAWAQHMGGADVAGNWEPLGSEVVLGKVKRRLQARLELCRQIQQLEERLISVPESVRGLFPARVHSELREFSPVVWEDFSACPHARDLISEQVCEPTDTFYRALLSRGTAKLTTLITIKPDYPSVPAVFCLSLQWQGEHTARNNNAIRDMEREMNVHWKEYPKLLAAQLLRLQACFDIYLESSALDEATPEFPREKVFFCAKRGRDRCVPFKYLQAGGGVFTHR